MGRPTESLVEIQRELDALCRRLVPGASCAVKEAADYPLDLGTGTEQASRVLVFLDVPFELRIDMETLRDLSEQLMSSKRVARVFLNISGPPFESAVIH